MAPMALQCCLLVKAAQPVHVPADASDVDFSSAAAEVEHACKVALLHNADHHNAHPDTPRAHSIVPLLAHAANLDVQVLLDIYFPYFLGAAYNVQTLFDGRAGRRRRPGARPRKSLL